MCPSAKLAPLVFFYWNSFCIVSLGLGTLPHMALGLFRHNIRNVIYRSIGSTNGRDAADYRERERPKLKPFKHCKGSDHKGWKHSIMTPRYLIPSPWSSVTWPSVILAYLASSNKRSINKHWWVLSRIRKYDFHIYGAGGWSNIYEVIIYHRA